MKRFDWNSATASMREAGLSRPTTSGRADVEATVRDIVRDVRTGGDRALHHWTRKLDGFDGPIRQVSANAFDEAWTAVASEIHAALDTAIASVLAFHQAQLPGTVVVETAPGMMCRRVARPLRTVGLYVPAGRAPLPSTVVMLGVPARLAGCPTRVMCTPPRTDGSVNPVLLVAARKCGIDTVFAVGGAQAIAAMAYGTASIPKCDKVFGPGNSYVDAAKQLVANDPRGAARDLPAGPSEVLVLADETADPLFVASDLLAQAEHDPVAHAVLATTSVSLADRVQELLPRLAGKLPESDTALAAIEHAVVVTARDSEQLIEIANQYAPEHLIINTANAEELVDRIDNAGSVFVGAWTPEVLGDYVSGTNHVLPTSGYARSFSGLSVESFMRFMTIQEATPDGFAALGPSAATLARAEGLTGHERSVLARIARIQKSQESTESRGATA